MTVTIEQDYSFIERTTAVAKLYVLRCQYVFQSRANRNLKASNVAWEQQYTRLRKLYDERVQDRDILEGIGVTHQPDGSWRFNFRTLLHNMAAEDIDDVKAALKDRCSLS